MGFIRCESDRENEFVLAIVIIVFIDENCFCLRNAFYKYSWNDHRLALRIMRLMFLTPPQKKAQQAAKI
jgi:hypothetical protein